MAPSTKIRAIRMSDNKNSRHPLRKLKRSIRELQERHRERHRPTGFGFVFADKVDYLDPAGWDEVTGTGSVFLSRDVLRVIERHGPENIQPRYAIIFRDDKAVAAVVVQVVTITGERLRREQGSVKEQRGPKLLRWVLAPAMHVATANIRERMLVAGSLLSLWFNGVGFLPVVNPAGLWPG